MLGQSPILPGHCNLLSCGEGFEANKTKKISRATKMTMTKTPSPIAWVINQLTSKWSLGRVMVLWMAMIVALSLYSPQAKAQTVPPPPAVSTATGTPFSVPEDDYFIKYLLKGVLGNVVNVNSSTAQATLTDRGNLGEVFRNFNLGIAFFGTLIVLFVAVVGILNTGNDGEFLGRRWSSWWVPIRFAGGAALMLPITNSGYSFVQALCLWIAGQGVGFADNVWSAVVETQTRVVSDVTAALPTATLVKDIALSNMCAAFSSRDKLDTSPIVYSPLPTTVDAKNNVRTEGGSWSASKDTIASTNTCGKWTYSYKRDDQDPLDVVRSLIGVMHRQEFERVQRVLDPHSKAFVEAIFSGDDAAKVAAAKTLVTAMATESARYNASLTLVAKGAMDASPLGDTARMAESMKKLGFASAGAFYMQMAKGANAVRSGFKQAPQYTGPDMEKMRNMAGVENWDSVKNYILPFMDDSVAASNIAVTPGLSSANSTTNIQTIGIDDSMFKDSKDGYNWTNKVALNIMRTVIGVGSANLPLTTAFEPGNTTNWYSSGSNNFSVIMQLKSKGDMLLDIAGVVYTGYVIGITVAAGANSSLAGKISEYSVGVIGGVLKFLEVISTVVIALVLSLVTLGVLLAVLIPMTPFMIWAMGIAGLLVLIIESLVASVIWAVMIMHPSGEGITSDHSRQGLMILLMLFARPALMVMGLACGMFMVDPMVDFVNDMFYFTFRNTQSESYSGLFIVFGICSVYTALILAIVRKSFALIHIVPDRVLRWIGGGPEQLGESEVADRGEHLAGGAGERVSNMGQVARPSAHRNAERAMVREQAAQQKRDSAAAQTARA